MYGRKQADQKKLRTITMNSGGYGFGGAYFNDRKGRYVYYCHPRLKRFAKHEMNRSVRHYRGHINDGCMYKHVGCDIWHYL